MMGVWVRRRVVVGLAIAALLLVSDGFVAMSASADIYQRRDRSGVLHFTNVPTSKGYRVMMREPFPPVRRRSASVRAGAGRIDSRTYDPIIADVATRYRVDKSLVKAVIRTESGFQPHAISPKGARGLMQLMPTTASMHGVRNIHEPSENIEGGVQHLRMLLDRYKDNVVLALAAYNAGEGAVDQHRGIPPFQETRDYVWRVLQFRQQYLQQAIAQAR
jgi:soluble lytic murein transglycosylase-like protein